eukprot:Gb_40217 [translate_table: standard]
MSSSTQHKLGDRLQRIENIKKKISLLATELEKLEIEELITNTPQSVNTSDTSLYATSVDSSVAKFNYFPKDLWKPVDIILSFGNGQTYQCKWTASIPITLQECSIELQENSSPTKAYHIGMPRDILQEFYLKLDALQKAGYYSNIARDRKVLQERLKKDPIPWNNSMTQVVHNIKMTCQHLPPLKIPGTGLNIIEVDASSDYWGAILKESIQEKEVICRYVLDFLSREGSLVTTSNEVNTIFTYDRKLFHHFSTSAQLSPGIQHDCNIASQSSKLNLNFDHLLWENSLSNIISLKLRLPHGDCLDERNDLATLCLGQYLINIYNGFVKNSEAWPDPKAWRNPNPLKYKIYIFVAIPPLADWMIRGPFVQWFKKYGPTFPTETVEETMFNFIWKGKHCQRGDLVSVDRRLAAALADGQALGIKYDEIEPLAEWKLPSLKPSDVYARLVSLTNPHINQVLKICLKTQGIHMLPSSHSLALQYRVMYRTTSTLTPAIKNGRQIGQTIIMHSSPNSKQIAHEVITWDEVSFPENCSAHFNPADPKPAMVHATNPGKEIMFASTSDDHPNKQFLVTDFMNLDSNQFSSSQPKLMNRIPDPLASLNDLVFVAVKDFEKAFVLWKKEKSVKEDLRKHAEEAGVKATEQAKDSDMNVKESITELVNRSISKALKSLRKQITNLSNKVSSPGSFNNTKKNKQKKKNKKKNIQQPQTARPSTSAAPAPPARQQPQRPEFFTPFAWSQWTGGPGPYFLNTGMVPLQNFMTFMPLQQRWGSFPQRNQARGGPRPTNDGKITNMAIHNLSKRTLSSLEKEFLGLSLNYIPWPPPMAPKSVRKEFGAFCRLLSLRWFFGPRDKNVSRSDKDEGFISPFRVPKPYWTPDEVYPPLEQIINSGSDLLESRLQSVTCRRSSMLPHKFKNALSSLCNDQSIIIQPVDKNLGLVILDKDWYVGKGLKQLSDQRVYEEVPTVPWRAMYNKLRALTLQLKGDSVLPDTEKDYLLNCDPSSARVCVLYFLPKIHKPSLVGRPICSYNGFMFEPASKWLHHILLPVLLAQPNHLLDSITLIKELKSLKVPQDTILFTFDVESLYPSIPTTTSLIALEFFIKGLFSDCAADFILKLANLVLTQHYLEFNGKFYRHKQGTTMGSNFAMRYIDDAFDIWTGSVEELNEYFSTYGSIFSDNTKITTEVSVVSVNILEIVFLKGPDFSATGILSTKCFQKPLNAYQYVPFSSNHPRHQKLSFISSELKIFLIKESTKEGFTEIKHKFFHRLRARGYPTKILLPLFTAIKFDPDRVFFSKSWFVQEREEERMFL